MSIVAETLTAIIDGKTIPAGAFCESPMYRNRITYLATPYTHDDPAVRAERFDVVNRVAGELMRKGEIVYSPISHTHPIAQECELPQVWCDFWEHQDRPFLEASYRLVVLKQDGWDKSRGVKAEIAIAEELGLPIQYMEVTFNE